MPLYLPTRHYSGVNLFTNTVGWSNVVTTDASGNAIYYLTSDGTAAGTALFSTIITSSIQLTPWNSSLILITGTPVVSGDNKTITVPVKQNSSLLSLGLIPFTTAASGQSITLTCVGVLL
jgi:hypothetical protein